MRCRHYDAGIGSIVSVLQAGKRPVVIPRRAQFKEHVDDHQTLIAGELAKRDLVVAAEADEVQWTDVIRAASSRVDSGNAPSLTLPDCNPGWRRGYMFAENEDTTVLISDGECKQALTSARSLAERGCAWPSDEERRPVRFNLAPPCLLWLFRAHRSAAGLHGDPAPYGEAIVAFVRDHGVQRYRHADGDTSIVELAPYHDDCGRLGCRPRGGLG